MTAGGVALVSGAGRGLGAAIARELAAGGWTVAVNYRSAAGRPRADRVVADIRSRGGHAEAFCADVTDEAAVAQLATAVVSRLGPVGALIVNATGPQPAVTIEDLTWQAHLDQLLFFVKSPTLLVQALLPGMKERRHGRIVQIGSDVFGQAMPGMSAYVAAKGAQLGLTRVWARELGPFGITVNYIAPGWIPVERHADVSPDALSGYLAGTPVGRMGVPGDVAAAAAYLASDAAGFITGECLTINGGRIVG